MTHKTTRRGCTQTENVVLKNKSHSRLQSSGMTPLFDNGLTSCGFTLIELLVVVLIIGLLAAVALPQYQKVVEKARAAEVITVLKSVVQIQQIYYLAHGSYPHSFEELNIDLPDTGETMSTPRIFCCTGTTPKPTKVINSDWAISIDAYGVYATRLQGKYANNAGFMLRGNSLHCAGSSEYCENIFKGKKDYTSGEVAFYLMN